MSNIRAKEPRRIGFVGLDAGRFLGWLHQIEEAVLVTRDQMGLKFSHPCLQIPSGAEEGGTLSLLEHPEVLPFLQKHQVKELVVFKPSFRVEEWAKKAGMVLLSGNCALGQRLENKAQFAPLAEEAGLPLPPYGVWNAPLPSWETVSEKLGPSLVLQSARGHSGQGTYRIRSAEEWEPHRQKSRGKWKVSSFLVGPTFTFNGVLGASPGEVVLGSLYRQRTGDPRCTVKTLGACGNVWASIGPPEEALKRVACRVGDFLLAQGLRGPFGGDLLWDEEKEKVRVIEVNTRLTSGLSMEGFLTGRSGGSTLLPLALQACRGQSLAPFSPVEGLHGAQAVLYSRHEEPHEFPHSIPSGRYEMASRAVLWKDSCVDPTQCAPNQAIVLARSAGQWIGAEGEWARIQVVGDESLLDPWVDWLAQSLT